MSLAFAQRVCKDLSIFIDMPSIPGILLFCSHSPGWRGRIMTPHHSNEGMGNAFGNNRHSATLCPVCSTAMVDLGLTCRCPRCRFLICVSCDGCGSPSICNFCAEPFDSGYSPAYT